MFTRKSFKAPEFVGEILMKWIWTLSFLVPRCILRSSAAAPVTAACDSANFWKVFPSLPVSHQRFSRPASPVTLSPPAPQHCLSSSLTLYRSLIPSSTHCRALTKNLIPTLNHNLRI